MKIKTLLFLSLFFLAKANAAACWNSNGTPTDVSYDLTATLTSAQNKTGATYQLNKSQQIAVNARCPENESTDDTTYRSYLSMSPVVETSGSWKYLPLVSEYIIGAMQITDSAAGTFYPPDTYLHMGVDYAVSDGNDFSVQDSNLKFQMKIVKPFIGTIVIPKKVMFNVYVTTGNNSVNDPLTKIVYVISYSGIITAPQSCVINAGQTILVDFGLLSANEFTTAGMKPKGATVKKFNVPINCNGGGNANFSLRLEANSTARSGLIPMVLSDNPDVGVVVSDDKGQMFRPNDFSSKLPFTTDPSGNANLTLQAIPVSATGILPAEGVFTALALLRIDYE